LVVLGFWSGAYEHTEFHIPSLYAFVILHIFSAIPGFAIFKSVAKSLRPQS
jgi:hypothetical protein